MQIGACVLGSIGNVVFSSRLMADSIVPLAPYYNHSLGLPFLVPKPLLAFEYLDGRAGRARGEEREGEGGGCRQGLPLNLTLPAL